MSHPIPVILDCDPGHDDALAITLALARPELNVLGITTVGGNAGLENTTRNALRILALLNRPDVPVASVYDRLRLAKGPSFGLATSLICPFLYLAHYDLVTSGAGRAELAAQGLAPELLRLGLGAEPAEDIIAALAEALD